MTTPSSGLQKHRLPDLCYPPVLHRHSTPLHFAAGYNRVPVVDFLLDHGADVHAKDKG